MIDHVREVLCPGPLSHRSQVIPSPKVNMQVNILYSHFENVHYCENALQYYSTCFILSETLQGQSVKVFTFVHSVNCTILVLVDYFANI